MIGPRLLVFFVEVITQKSNRAVNRLLFCKNKNVRRQLKYAPFICKLQGDITKGRVILQRVKRKLKIIMIFQYTYNIQSSYKRLNHQVVLIYYYSTKCSSFDLVVPRATPIGKLTASNTKLLVSPYNSP